MLVCSAQASSFSLYLRAAQPARQVVAADVGALRIEDAEGAEHIVRHEQVAKMVGVDAVVHPHGLVFGLLLPQRGLVDQRQGALAGHIAHGIHVGGEVALAIRRGTGHDGVAGLQQEQCVKTGYFVRQLIEVVAVGFHRHPPLGVDVVEPDHERDHLRVERRDAALEGLQNVRGGVPADTGVDHHIHVASQLVAQPFVEYLRVVPVAMRMQGPMRDTCTAKQPGLRLRMLEDGVESLHVVLNSRIL